MKLSELRVVCFYQHYLCLAAALHCGLLLLFDLSSDLFGLSSIRASPGCPCPRLSSGGCGGRLNGLAGTHPDSAGLDWHLRCDAEARLAGTVFSCGISALLLERRQAHTGG